MIKGRCRLAYNMTYDFIASALAMAARCFCPPYKLLGYRSISWASPTFSRRASGIFFAFSGSSFFTTICASVTFSSSVLCGNKLKDWNTMPTFFRKLCALFKNRSESLSWSETRSFTPSIVISHHPEFLNSLSNATT